MSHAVNNRVIEVQTLNHWPLNEHVSLLQDREKMASGILVGIKEKVL